MGPLLAELEIWASEGDPTAGQWLSSTAPAHKIKPPGILPRLPAATRGSGVRNRYSDPTSTRAGGQDDVSYTNSLKQKGFHYIKDGISYNLREFV